jgi:tetratricopeptide (TPR) repeat protein
VLLRSIGRVREGAELLDRVIEEAVELGDDALLASARRNRISPMGDPELDPTDYRIEAETNLDAYRRRGDLRAAAVAGRALGLALRRGGHLADGCAALERALVDAAASGDVTIRRQVAGTLAYALCDGPTQVREAIERCRQLLESTRGHRADEAVITRCLAALYGMAGRLDEARDCVERSGPILDELNLVSISWVYKVVAAEAKELIGDLAGAEEELRAKWMHFRNRGDCDPDARAMVAACLLALLYCDEGRWEDAEACLEYGSEVPEPPYFLHEAVVRLAAAGRVAAHRGELPEAIAYAERAVALAGRSDFLNLRARVCLAAADVQRAAGRGSEAHAATVEALRLYEAKGNVTAAAPLRALLAS